MKKNYMKKGIVLALCMGLVIAFSGCGSSDSNDNTQQEQQDDTTTQDVPVEGDTPVQEDMGTEENPS